MIFYCFIGILSIVYLNLGSSRTLVFSPFWHLFNLFCGDRYGHWVVSMASNELLPRSFMSEPPKKLFLGLGVVY